jgi:hypothetical protein
MLFPIIRSLLKIVMIIALISGLTMLASSTQQTFAVIGGVGGGSAGATTGAGGGSTGSPTGASSTGQSPDPHLFCITGMKTPICK